MIELDVNKENLELFFKNIRKHDLSELKFLLKTNLKNKFIDSCLNSHFIYMIADDDSIPLAVGGCRRCVELNEKIGQIWLLCTNSISKSSIEAFNYIENKIYFFQNEFDFLFNFIYKSNFSFLPWLKKRRFEVLDYDADFKLFYYSKGDVNFDLRCIAGK